VAGDQLVIVVGDEHPWVTAPPQSLSELGGTEWVLREAGSGTRSEFEHALEAVGVPAASLNVAMQLPSNEAVRAAVEAGMGATAISASVAAPSIEAGLLHLIRLDLPERDFCVVHHRQRAPSRAAEALLDLIRPHPTGGSGQG
jgi:DNA-binding transcriptional LysR family regulator